MLTKKPVKIDEEKAAKYIAGAPLDAKATTAKTTKPQQTYLHIPISRELRNQLKAASALKGKSLYDFCTDVLEKAMS